MQLTLIGNVSKCNIAPEDAPPSVTLKQVPGGIVIEVNDNPNLDHGWEDAAEKDEVWVRLTQWFLDRLERTGR